MFEKEAEEIAKRKISNFIPQQWGVSLIRTEPTWETVEGAPHFYLNSLAKMWQDGADFGYNKANEWHYVKDGDLPKGLPKPVLVLFHNKFSDKIVIDTARYSIELNKWWFIHDLKDLEEDVIAWKEIVLPELPKESK